MNSKKTKNSKIEKFVSKNGPDIAVAGITAISSIVAGPVGAVVSSIIGVPLSDFLKRHLSKQEKSRLERIASIVNNSVQARLDKDDHIRQDNFFDFENKEQCPASEIFEGVLMVAKNSYEEKKIEYLGNLFTNIAFDKTCSQSEANYQLHIAESLTYSQLVLLQIFSKPDNWKNLRTTKTPKKIFYETLSLLQAIRELCSLDLVIMQEPNATHHTFVMEINHICPSHLKLAIGGERLHYLLGLETMPDEEVENIAQWLR